MAAALFTDPVAGGAAGAMVLVAASSRAAVGRTAASTERGGIAVLS
jgi:hypothetical protein